MLDSILTRTASAGLLRRRSMACAAPDDAVWFLADCVESTILPRDLQFFVNRNAILKVRASGGRLFEILEIGEEARFDGAPRSIAADDMADLCRALRRLFADAAHIAVVPTEPAAASWGPAFGGIAGHALMQAQHCVPFAVSREERLATLLTAAQDVFLAVRRDPGESNCIAEDILTPAMNQWIGAMLSRLEASGAMADDERLIFVRPPDEAAMTLACHVAGGVRTAILIHRDAETDVAKYWASL